MNKSFERRWSNRKMSNLINVCSLLLAVAVLFSDASSMSQSESNSTVFAGFSVEKVYYSADVLPSNKIRLRWMVWSIFDCDRTFQVEYTNREGILKTTNTNRTNQNDIDIDDINICQKNVLNITETLKYSDKNETTTTFDSVSVDPKVPGPVTNLQASTDANGVRLVWAPPVNYPECVDKYNITHLWHRDGVKRPLTLTKNLYLNVALAEECGLNSFEVESLNVLGQKRGIAIVNHTFVPKDLFQNVTLQYKNEGFSLFWNTSTKACYELIQVKICHPNDTCQEYFAKNETQIVDNKLIIPVKNLMLGVQYLVTISAPGGHPYEFFVTIKAEVPGPVTNLQASTDANGIRLVWAPPVNNTKCADKYNITHLWYRDGVKRPLTQTKNLYLNVALTEECGLNSFEVESLNVLGEGSEIAKVNHTFVPEDLFQNVTLQYKNEGFSLFWNTSTKACYELIQVKICHPNKSCQEYFAKNEKQIVDNELTIPVKNLIPGVQYTITISAPGGHPYEFSETIKATVSKDVNSSTTMDRTDRTFEGNLTLIKEIQEIADQVKENSTGEVGNLNFTSFVINVSNTSTDIELQDKSDNGIEVKLFEHAVQQLVDSNITVIIFEAKIKSKDLGDIVKVETKALSEPSNNSVLRIKFAKNNTADPTNPNWTCVYWVANISLWSDHGINTELDSEFVTCLSNHLSTFSILLPNQFSSEPDDSSQICLTPISRLGSGITIYFLGLVIIINYRKKTGNETRKILMQSCFALLLTHGTYQIHTFLEGYNVYRCLNITFMKYYFVLAYLLWTAADGINMWRILLLDVFNTRGYIFYRWYKIISWGAPLISVSIGLFYINWRGECNFKINKTYDLIFYLVPWIVILCCNMLLFTWLLLNITCKNKLGRLKDKKISYVLALTQVFGIGWSVVFPLLYFKSTHLLGEYMLAGVISTQGLLIFIVRGGCLQNSPKKSKKPSPSVSASRSCSTSTLKINGISNYSSSTAKVCLLRDCD